MRLRELHKTRNYIGRVSESHPAIARRHADASRCCYLRHVRLHHDVVIVSAHGRGVHCVETTLTATVLKPSRKVKQAFSEKEVQWRDCTRSTPEDLKPARLESPLEGLAHETGDSMAGCMSIMPCMRAMVFEQARRIKVGF